MSVSFGSSVGFALALAQQQFLRLYGYPTMVAWATKGVELALRQPLASLLPANPQHGFGSG
jgi:hypothetical protein